MNDINNTRYDNDGNAVKDALDSLDAVIDERYIIERIDRIISDNSYINDALRALEALDASNTSDTVNGGRGVQGKAEAIANVVQSREATNQQMLSMLEKMLDRSHSSGKEDKLSLELSRYEKVSETLRSFVDNDGDYPEQVLEILDRISQRLFD